MKILILIFTILTLVSNATTLDTLLQDVTNATNKQLSKDVSREKEFLKDMNIAKKQLADIKALLEKEKTRTKMLKETFETQKSFIQKQNLELEKKGENLKDIFTITQQEAANLGALVHTSMTTTQIKERSVFLDNLSLSKNNPSIDEIKTLWQKYFEEIIESGKIVTYKSQIVTSEGNQANAIVSRIGIFSAFNDSEYLRYDDSLGQFVQLTRQPNGTSLDYISGFQHPESEVVPVLIDPTRGVLFSMLKEKATIKERIEQGGVIGYIILFLGVLTLIYSLAKFLTLFRLDINIKHQMKSEEVKDDNPLGRILKSFEKHKNKDTNTIESKLDSALVKEIPTILSGLPMVKLIAAVAPLLGLLGTVTGMIETFQSITLFGTGDPKLMAGGISQALMTTVLGLVVAIPILFIYNILNAKAKKIIEVLTQQSSAVIARHLDVLNENTDSYKNSYE